MIILNRKLVWTLPAVAAAMVGCAGTTGAGSTADELLLADSLDSISESSWTTASAGCEGLLEGGVHFAIASVEAGLIAAVTAEGDVVCIDTVEAVQEELDESGREDEADQLADDFNATIAAQAADPHGSRFTGPNREGDPDPEPNTDWDRFQLEGDPDPEPNSQG